MWLEGRVDTERPDIAGVFYTDRMATNCVVAYESRAGAAEQQDGERLIVHGPEGIVKCLSPI